MEPIKNGKELEGLINKIYKILEQAHATISKNTNFEEVDGKVEGYSSLKLIFDSSVESSIKKTFDSILDKTGIKEKIDNENLNYIYQIEKNQDTRLGFSEILFVLEANKGDYKKMTDPKLSENEEVGYFETKSPKELFEEENDEYRRHF